MSFGFCVGKLSKSGWKAGNCQAMRPLVPGQSDPRKSQAIPIPTAREASKTTTLT